MLFTWVPDLRSWLTVRQVLAVDGAPVSDSRERLQRTLHDTTGPDRVLALRRLRDEGARFNLGRIERNFNDPTLVLQFMDPAFQPRFTFSVAGADRINGVDAWKVRFAEELHPTLIRSNGVDLTSSGLLWISRNDGVVVRTSLAVTYAATNTHADIVWIISVIHDSGCGCRRE
jgi:hypothetical protein